METRTQELNVVVACWVGAVSRLSGLKVLFGVYVCVAKHDPAVDAIVGCVVAMYCAVETMVGRSGLLDACVGIGSCG